MFITQTATIHCIAVIEARLNSSKNWKHLPYSYLSAPAETSPLLLQQNQKKNKVVDFYAFTLRKIVFENDCMLLVAETMAMPVSN